MITILSWFFIILFGFSILGSLMETASEKMNQREKDENEK